MRNFLVMQTDFSLKSAAVSVMHGVSYQVDRDLIVEDISHEVAKWSPYAASTNLAYTLPYWPVGTVFVSVIDPGVGTDRKACVAKTKNGYYIVTPDNGALTHVVQEYGIEEVRVIDETVNRYPGTEQINIFHGRDLFAYCGAKLASGKITFEEVGPAYNVSEIVIIETPDAYVQDGMIYGFNKTCNANFGINVSNIPVDLLEKIDVKLGDMVHLNVSHNGKVHFDEDVLYHRSFGYVAPGEPICYNAEGMLLGFALNLENFMERYHTQPGPDWQVTIRKV